MTRPIHLPLDTVLALLASEMETASGLADQAAEAIAEVLGDPARPLMPPGIVAKAQALDELGQRIAGLRAYLRDLARVAPRDTAIEVGDAASCLPLAAQSAHLSGAGEIARPVVGVVELF